MAKDFVETLLSLSKLVEGLNFLRFPRDISPSPSLPSSLEKRGKKNKERKEGRKKERKGQVSAIAFDEVFIRNGEGERARVKCKSNQSL